MANLSSTKILYQNFKSFEKSYFINPEKIANLQNYLWQSVELLTECCTIHLAGDTSSVATDKFWLTRALMGIYDLISLSK